MRAFVCFVAFVALALFPLLGCARTSSEVIEKVKYDFGLGDKPEGYVTGEDKVMEQLDTVGKQEIERLNREGRRGEVQFEEEGMLRGKYYKRMKVYESFYPLDARSDARTHDEQGGYTGYISYEYAVYESPRHATRAEAEADSASIRTGETDRETFRYSFNRGGTWNGRPGERTR